MSEMQETLKGIIDLHIHTGPSVAVRKLDAVEMMRDAIKYGYKAYVVKDHYFPSVMTAEICQKYFSDDNVKVIGGIALNNSVGGLNVKALDAAVNMGAKFVYMPTVSARCHIESHWGASFPGAGNVMPEDEIYYLNSEGGLSNEAVEVLNYISSHPDVVLATGHGTVEEIDALIKRAVKMGIAKIYVNHPFYMINADIDQIVEWAELGAFIEINACVFLFGEHPTPLSVAKEIFDKVALDKIVICSDLGQRNNSLPTDGIYEFIKKLKNEYGINVQQIDAATKINPEKLLGLVGE